MIEKIELSKELQSVLDAFDGLAHIKVHIHDNFRPIYASSGLLKQYGFQSMDEFYKIDSILDIIHEDVKESAIERYSLLMDKGVTPPIEVQSTLHDGSVVWYRIEDKCILINNRKVAMTIVNDISDYKNREDNLNNLANYDVLTGLANRRNFWNSSEALLNSFPEDSALFVMDIDSFKLINDHYGHYTGDSTICTFADICKKCVRKTDILARYGGDEFTLFAPGIGKDRAMILAEKIRSSVEMASTKIDGKAINFTVSIGFSISSKNGKYSITRLLKEADIGLYQSKNKGRNSVTPYSSEPSGNVASMNCPA